MPSLNKGSRRKITDQYATYFVTMTIVGWIDIFTRKQCAQLILDSFRYCQQKKGLILYAYVIMGSHLHILASAREGSSGLSAIIRDFKSFTSKEIIKWITDNRKESRRRWLTRAFKFYGKYNSNNELYQVWQQYNCPIQCITPAFTMQKLNYIHNNPVKAGIVDQADEYRWSSARNYSGRNDAPLDVTFIDAYSWVGYNGYR